MHSHEATKSENLNVIIKEDSDSEKKSLESPDAHEGGEELGATEAIKVDDDLVKPKQPSKCA